MTNAQAPLSWTELNPDTLQSEVKEAYRNYQQIYAKAKAAREKFEKLFAVEAELPNTHRLLFSYKYGRLSVARDVAKLKNVSPKAIDFDTLKAGLRDLT